MLPNPMYTGAAPAWRNSSISGGGEYWGAFRKKNPQTSVLVNPMVSNLTLMKTYQYVLANLKASALIYRPQELAYHF